MSNNNNLLSPDKDDKTLPNTSGAGPATTIQSISNYDVTSNYNSISSSRTSSLNRSSAPETSNDNSKSGGGGGDASQSDLTEDKYFSWEEVKIRYDSVTSTGGVEDDDADTTTYLTGVLSLFGLGGKKKQQSAATKKDDDKAAGGLLPSFYKHDGTLNSGDGDDGPRTRRTGSTKQETNTGSGPSSRPQFAFDRTKGKRNLVSDPARRRMIVVITRRDYLPGVVDQHHYYSCSFYSYFRPLLL